MTSETAGTPPLLDRLVPGAAQRPLRHGRLGLLWDAVEQMPRAAREQWRELVVPVATAAFDGTTPAFWARPGTAVPDRVRAIARDAAADLGQAAQLDPGRLHVAGAYSSTPDGLWRDRPGQRRRSSR